MGEDAPGLANNNTPSAVIPVDRRTGFAFAKIDGNGKWSIFSSERELPVLGGFGHHYIVLVDPSGKVIREIHGSPSAQDKFWQGFRASGPPIVPDPEQGDFLAVEIVGPDGFLSRGAIYSQKLVKSYNSQIEATQAFISAYNLVQLALDQKHFLYNGAAFILGSGTSRNSNSVWFTGLKALGVADPLAFAGPLIAPGREVELDKAPSNNPLFLSKIEDERKAEAIVYNINTARFRHGL